MCLRCFSFPSSYRHISERLTRECDGIGRIVVPQTLVAHQLFEWSVDKGVAVLIDAKTHRGSWPMVGAYLYVNEWLNTTGPEYPLLPSMVGLSSSKHFSLEAVWHFCNDVLHSPLGLFPDFTYKQTPASDASKFHGSGWSFPGFAFRLYYVGLEQIQPVATSPHNWGVCLVSSVPDIPGVMRFCNSWWEHTLLLAWCELHGYLIFLKRFLASELPPTGMLGAGGVPVRISTTFFLVADLTAIRCSSLLLDTLPP